METSKNGFFNRPPPVPGGKFDGTPFLHSSGVALSKRAGILALLTLALGFRFYFGLHCPTIQDMGDDVQTYLIGLKCYATHTWPYFGPDVVGTETTFTTQIPGALEGLLIALPLEIWPSPESPYLFLNLMTFLSLSLLAWYVCRRFPGLSPALVFAWIYVAPWNLHYSTEVINPSYAVPGSVLFFLGFFESVPALSLGLLSPRVANALMGFSFFWIMQLHMSWMLFVPFLLLSFFYQWKSAAWKTALGFGALGALPMWALMIPTYARYGFRTGGDIQGFTSGLNLHNVISPVTILARLLSFASFEMPRFLGLHTADRIAYLFHSPWLLVPGFLLWGAGYLQAVGLFVLWFRRDSPRSDWRALKGLMLFTFLVIYASFWFTVKPPLAHIYYLMFPVVMIYSFHGWDWVAAKPNGKTLARVFLAIAVFFQVGYALQNARDRVSTYSQNRGLMVKAIEARDYRILAERRPNSLY